MTKPRPPKRPAGLAKALGLSAKRAAREASRFEKQLTKDGNAAIREAEISIKSALRWSKSVERKAASDFRRASPAENVRMGFTPKARRYVEREAKITARTRSISARAAETKRTRERYGFKTPEAATRARRHEGGPGYSSKDQERRVIKATQTRLFKRIERAANAHEKIPYDPLGKRPQKRSRWITLKPGDEERYRDLRARRLRGEWFDDIADFVWLMDMSRRFGDQDAKRLRGSPDARSPGEADEDDEGDYDEAA